MPPCAAEMLAAQQLNQREGLTYPVSYGGVTSGIEGRFLRLQATLVPADPNAFSHRELGVFDFLLTQFNLAVPRQ